VDFYRFLLFVDGDKKVDCGCTYRSVYTPSGQESCSACPLNTECNLVSCPVCGYQTVDIQHSHFARFLSHLIQRPIKPIPSKNQDSQSVDCKNQHRHHKGFLRKQRVQKNPHEYSIIDVPIGKTACIVKISPSLKSALVNRLHAQGLTFGSLVKVIQQTPITVLQIDHLELALEHELASCIIVSGII
jgi:Fe2+ transport system protein FeoA